MSAIWLILGAFALGAISASMVIAVFYVPDRVLWLQRAGIAGIVFLLAFIGWSIT